MEANNVLTLSDTDKLLMIYEKEPTSGYSYDDEVILAMKKGIINGKNFSNKVIAEFLKKNPAFTKEDMVQLLPNVNDTDGFFICKMRKAESIVIK